MKTNVWKVLFVIWCLVLLFWGGYEAGHSSRDCSFSYKIPEPKVEVIEKCTITEARAMCQQEWVEATRRWE